MNPQEDQYLTSIIGVRFKANGKMYYFDPKDKQVQTGQAVIVETARGLEYGECVQGNTEVPEQSVVQPLKSVIRVATDADRETLKRNQKRADEAYIICKRKIEERGLEMNLVTVECTFDMNKMLFYFTADGRVDFRELVKDLASVFRTRIELRQIGVRDEAKMIGGLGACGRELCCSSYLEDFHPVSINMAKEQNLSLNPAKISGTCGRLMCCLKYEHEAYAELQKVTPKNGSIVETPDGRGRVVSTQMLRGTCKVQLDDSTDHTPVQFQCTECCMVRGGGGCRGRGCCGGGAEQEAEKQDKPEKAERPERADKPERTDKPRAERPAKQDKPRAERPVRQDKPRPERQPAAVQADEVQPDAPAEDEASAEGAPRRRRRRGGRRRTGRKPGEDGEQQSEGTSEE